MQQPVCVNLDTDLKQLKQLKQLKTMKQVKVLLLLLLLLLLILVFKQYDTEISTLDMNTSDMPEMRTPGAEIESLKVTDKEELLDADSELKVCKDLEELRKCHDEYIKERNELFLRSICDGTFGSDIDSISSEESHRLVDENIKDRFIYTIRDKTIQILNSFDNDIEKEKRMLNWKESRDVSPIKIVPETDTVLDTVSDTMSDTMSDTVSDTMSDTMSDTVPGRASGTASERLETLIRNIEDHPELSEAEKELAVSSILYGDMCPLEFLEGYSEYKEEFFISNPTGHDPVSGFTFEESINYYISLGKRVRENLEQDI